MRRDSSCDLVFVAVAAVAMAMLLGAMGWLGWQLEVGRRVVGSESIGTLQAVTGGGGERVAMVLETSRGFYPLQEPVALARGVALVLQVRRNGRWFVCDADDVHCVGGTGLGHGLGLGFGGKEPDQRPTENQVPKGDGR